MTSHDHIDVVIATRDRPDDLVRAVRSLERQDWQHFDVFVMDQSTDPSANHEAIRSLDDVRFHHLPTASRGKSRALNEALRQHSRAASIAFTDDDCEVPADWLSNIATSLQRHPDAAIIFGTLAAIEHDETTTFVPAIVIEQERVWQGPVTRTPGLLGMGANMVVPRKTFRRVGCFDEQLGPGGILRTGEECELMYRCFSQELSIVQDPTLQVLHWGARERTGGVADRLLSDGFYATMAGHGKHVRQGDKYAIAITLDETIVQLRMVVEAVFARTRPLHLRRLGTLASGFVAGARRGPAWPSADP